MVCPACGQFHNRIVSRRDVDVTMEPPLVKGKIHERSYRVRLVGIIVPAIYRTMSAIGLNLHRKLEKR